ncbi:hypothetical protein M885DRAFT_526220 [Pelagophyceae sp. CCMP2097]|nr:hypothetical protein M885DRAFT_526220 [Pelagophyceae sp. CCMP2097]
MSRDQRFRGSWSPSVSDPLRDPVRALFAAANNTSAVNKNKSKNKSMRSRKSAARAAAAETPAASDAETPAASEAASPSVRSRIRNLEAKHLSPTDAAATEAAQRHSTRASEAEDAQDSDDTESHDSATPDGQPSTPAKRAEASEEPSTPQGAEASDDEPSTPRLAAESDEPSSSRAEAPDEPSTPRGAEAPDEQPSTPREASDDEQPSPRRAEASDELSSPREEAPESDPRHASAVAAVAAHLCRVLLSGDATIEATVSQIGESPGGSVKLLHVASQLRRESSGVEALRCVVAELVKTAPLEDVEARLAALDAARWEIVAAPRGPAVSLRPAVTGFLRKRGFVNTRWRTRWFEARPRQRRLDYYRKCGDVLKRGCIELAGCVCEDADDEALDQNPFAFRIVAARTWVLQASSDHERQRWVHYIREMAEAPIEGPPSEKSVPQPPSEPRPHVIIPCGLM